MNKSWMPKKRTLRLQLRIGGITQNKIILELLIIKRAHLLHAIQYHLALQIKL